MWSTGYVACRHFIQRLTSIPQLREAVSSEVASGSADVNVLEWMGRTALELIGQGGLGYSFDPLVTNKPNQYGDALKNFAYVNSSPLHAKVAHLRRCAFEQAYYVCPTPLACAVPLGCPLHSSEPAEYPGSSHSSW